MSDDMCFDIVSSDDPAFDPVRQLLRRWNLRDYLARKPPSSVVTLGSDCSCGHALRTLALHGISSLPVFDSTSVCLGFLDVSDLLRALLSIVNVRDLTEENKDFQLRSAGLQLEHQQLHSLHLSQDGALIYKADLQSTLHDVIVYGFLQPNAAGHTQAVHRVGVFDSQDDLSDDDLDTADDQYSAGRRLQGIETSAQASITCDISVKDYPGLIILSASVTHVISQSDVLQFLARHVSELGPLTALSVRQLGLADKAVVCVPEEMSTIHAYATMMANKVSCVGVISHSTGGGLAASLSSSDLLGLLPEHFVALSAPVLQYLTAKASTSWTAQQPVVLKASRQLQPLQHGAKPLSPQMLRPLQQQQDQEQLLLHQQQHNINQPQCIGSASAWGLKGGEGLKCPQVLSCSPECTFQEVLQLMAGHNSHRLHVLDERQRPVGIITITDLLRDIDLEQVEQVAQFEQAPDCNMGMDTGHELIEPHNGLLPVTSIQGLIDTA